MYEKKLQGCVADAECALQTVLFNGHVCIEMKDILGWYGFTMDDVWAHRPYLYIMEVEDINKKKTAN